MAGKKSDDGGAGAKKTRTRAKRPRLGRGLSALVDAPIAVEIEQDSKSDNLTDVGGDQVGVGGDQGKSGGVAGGVAGGGKTPSVSFADTSPASAGEESRVAGQGVGGEVKRTGLVGGKSAQTPVSTEVTALGASDSTGDLRVAGERVVELAVGLIGVNRDQPRRVFDEEALGALAESISAHGVMQPIVVRRVEGGSGRQGSPHPGPLPGGEGGRGDGQVVEGDAIEYELIAGERRWRASKLAGLGVVPAIVRDVDDVTSAQLALIENVQREDLNVVELAEGYRALADRYGMTQEKISKAVGVSRSSVANVVRLLELPEEVRVLISGGALSSGHGKVLLSLGSPEKQRKFAARAIKEGWNVRLLERAINDENGEQNLGKLPDVSGKKDDERALSVLRDLEVRVGEQLGTRVRIKTDKSRQKGRVVIEFYDLDQFDGLLGRLGVSMEG